MWARWAALAAVQAASEEKGAGRWLRNGELCLDTWGSSWGVMAWAGDGRAVLFGEDEGSKTKWHKEPIDLLAGAPEWLPHARLRDHVEHYELGFVYWYDDGTWHRAPYPDDLQDDGLELAMDEFLIRSEAVAELESWLADHTDGAPEAVVAACGRFMEQAERRTLTTDAVRAFTDETGWADADIAAICAVARDAGLMGAR